MPDRHITRIVIEGVAPLSEAGLRGLWAKVDSVLAGPYLRLLVMAVCLIVLGGLIGEQSAQDTIVFSLLAISIAAVLMILPALIRRIGEQPEGRRPTRQSSLDLVSVAISAERILVARAARSGLEVDQRLSPRLRDDVGVLLLANHGLDLETEEHHPRIEAMVGTAAWHVIRTDREDFPVWKGLSSVELDEVLYGCLNVLGDDKREQP